MGTSTFKKKGDSSYRTGAKRQKKVFQFHLRVSLYGSPVWPRGVRVGEADPKLQDSTSRILTQV